tara:strand:- start:4063 stop:4767 length:705 start_codon:yes stop_codon:yes gene_type:complete
MRSAFAVEYSSASKIKGCSATYASHKSCPSTCPFLPPDLGGQDGGGGCFAAVGRAGMHARRLLSGSDESLAIAKEEAAAINALPGFHDLRLHVSGDCVGDAEARIVSAASDRHDKRLRETATYTFTHSWRNIDRASWGNVSVLASCHNMEEVKEARALGYPASMTVKATEAKKFSVVDGFKLVQCPAKKDVLTCANCRKCMDGDRLFDRKIVVLFPYHGSQQKLAAQSVEVYNG